MTAVEALHFVTYLYGVGVGILVSWMWRRPCIGEAVTDYREGCKQEVERLRDLIRQHRDLWRQHHPGEQPSEIVATMWAAGGLAADDEEAT